MIKSKQISYMKSNLYNIFILKCVSITKITKFIYLFLIYLKLTTQAVHIYTIKIAILLKIDIIIININ